MNKKKLTTAYLDISIPQNVENMQLPNPELLTFYKNFEDRTLWIDDEINDSTVTEISKEMSGCMYAVFRSGSSMTDEMLANIEQIFKTYSPQTKIRIL